MCRQLAATLRPGLHRLFYIPLSTGNVMDMYKAIAWLLGLPIERNRASAYRAVDTEVCRLYTECRVLPVLVVDEAHHLRNECSKTCVCSPTTPWIPSLGCACCWWD